MALPPHSSGTEESRHRDPPPRATFDGQLEPVTEDVPADGEDLRRADQEEAGVAIFDPNAAVGAAWDTFGESGGGD